MKKWVVECIWAIKNEIVVDDVLYTLFNSSAKEYACIPRPSKWINRFSKKNIFLKIILKLTRFFWLVGLGPLFSFMEMLKWEREWRRVYVPIETPEGEFALGFSTRAFEIIPKALESSHLNWIIVPWIIPNPAPAITNQISILSLLTPGDFSLALSLAKKVHLKMAMDKTLSQHIVQNYVVYRWLIVRIALERFKGRNFYTAEHFDRWAVLADRLNSLTLIQHGALGSLDVNDEFAFKLDYKLRNVRHLYVFNKFSERLFLDFVLAKKPLEISKFNTSIQLQDVKAINLKVLFVGHTICEDFQIALYQKILKKYKMTIYYKFHPLSPPSEKVKNQGWQLISDKSFFPRVDLLVSYPSTLVDEYAIYEIPATLHSLNASSSDLESVLKSIEANIEKIKN